MGIQFLTTDFKKGSIARHRRTGIIFRFMIFSFFKQILIPHLRPKGRTTPNSINKGY